MAKKKIITVVKDSNDRISVFWSIPYCRAAAEKGDKIITKFEADIPSNSAIALTEALNKALDDNFSNNFEYLIDEIAQAIYDASIKA